MSQAFSEVTLRSFEPKVIAKVKQLSATFLEPPGVRSTELSQLHGWSTAKDMARCCEKRSAFFLLPLMRDS